MRAKVLQIVWHDKLPVFAVDFHPSNGKFATAGGDNYVRIWTVTEDQPDKDNNNAPNIELLANLNRHTKSVNVARFSPDGEMLATAGDDGTVIIWKCQGLINATKSRGNLAVEDDMEDKETWAIVGVLRSQVEDIYDLSWSPDGTMLITGGIDNVIRIWDTVRFKLVREICDHSHYVQGVSWDPRGRYIASQSSDRSMRVYELKWKNKENLVPICIARNFHAENESNSEDENNSTPINEKELNDESKTLIEEYHNNENKLNHDSQMEDPITTMEILPQPNQESDLIHSTIDNVDNIDGNNTQMSSQFATQITSAATIKPQKLFLNENVPSFFRRLSFSPDGSLLVTTAGQHRESDGIAHNTVYIYTRRNFKCPAVCLFSFTKPVIGIRFHPKFYQLRQNIESLFQLPYRMIYAVLTLDSVYLYDTQQIKPLAIMQNLHYAALTDISWHSNGHRLLITSVDGFCSLVDFESGELGDLYEETVQIPNELKRRQTMTREAETIKKVDESNVAEPMEEGEKEKPVKRRIQPTLISSPLTLVNVL